MKEPQKPILAIGDDMNIGGSMFKVKKITKNGVLVANKEREIIFSLNFITSAMKLQIMRQ